MLGKFIRIKRENAGLSQKQFAEQLFVTESAVSKWERGVNYPDITMISDICRVCLMRRHAVFDPVHCYGKSFLCISFLPFGYEFFQ
mgnify:CR=1 FL=1